MKIPAFIQPFIRRLRLATWPQERRLALLRILDEVYRADGQVADDEESQLQEVAELLAVEVNDLKEMTLETAAGELRAHPQSMEIACVYIASAVFADDDYDPAEKATIQLLIEQYGLPAESLERRIREARNRELDEVLEDWLDDLAED